MGSARPRTAVIAGAGIGGLAAGVALLRAGWRVQIFERAANPRELGFALLLAPNAIASLRRLGIADTVIAGGAAPARAELRGRHGRVLRAFDATRARPLLPEMPVVVLRPVLHGALLDAVGRDVLVLDTAVVGVEPERSRPLVHLANGTRVDADVVVGADGVGSAVRRVLHASEPPPRRSGLWGIRGVADERLAPLGDVSAVQYFGRGVEAGVSRAGGSALYWYMSVPDALLGDIRDPLAIAARSARDFDEIVQRVVGATQTENVRLDELLDREPLDPWGRGAVTLLGDAAHPMLPHAGQGAAQALEDAVALGRVLAGDGDVTLALRRYEQVRRVRTAEIARTARRNAAMASLTNPVARWLRDLAIRWVPESQLLKAYVAFGTPPEV